MKAIGGNTTSAAASAEEAEFIRLCDRLAAIHQEEDAAFVAISDDDARDAATAPLHEEWHRIKDRLYELEAWPQTRPGIAAAARAALAFAQREIDGSIASESLAEALAWWIVETTEPETARAEAGTEGMAS